MGRERRQHGRLRTNWPARVGWRELGIGQAVIRDISKDGMFLETLLIANKGDRLLIEFKVDDQGVKALAEGTIERVAAASAPLKGYGIRVTRLDPVALRTMPR